MAEPGLLSTSSAVGVGSAEAVNPGITRRGERILASPKSSTLVCPLRVQKMLAGLMSRCTIPFA